MKTLWVAALAAVVGCGAGKSVTVVDRLEEGRAVLVTERGEEVPAAAAELPAGTREGDVLVDGRRDDGARTRQKAEISALRRRLNRAETGDLSLETP
jgi:hypothetical protein